MKLQLKAFNGEVAAVLPTEALDAFRVAEGDELTLRFLPDGAARLSSARADREYVIERGKAFVERYRPTFEALAK